MGPVNSKALCLLIMGIVLALATPGRAGGGLHAGVQLGGKDRAAATGVLAVDGLLVLSRSGDVRRFPLFGRLDQGFVIIDAIPPEARVSLDGRLLGSARQLVARAFRVAPGPHTVEIVAPGFRPYRAYFTVDPSIPRWLRIALEPE